VGVGVVVPIGNGYLRTLSMPLGTVGVGAGDGGIPLGVGGVQGVRVLANSNRCSIAGPGSNVCSNLPVWSSVLVGNSLITICR
jgi:hypothetical protein